MMEESEMCRHEDERAWEEGQEQEKLVHGIMDLLWERNPQIVINWINRKGREGYALNQAYWDRVRPLEPKVKNNG